MTLALSLAYWIPLGLFLYALIVLCIIGLFIGNDAIDRAMELELRDEAPEQMREAA